MKTPKYFTLEEMLKSDTAINKKIRNYPSWEVIQNLNTLCLMLDKIRERLGMPITVTSGYRSKELNTAVKASKTSQHMSGQAADCKCRDNKKLFDTVKQMIEEGEITVGQLIWEYGTKKSPDWCHISIPNPNSNTRNQILYIGVK